MNDQEILKLLDIQAQKQQRRQQTLGGQNLFAGIKLRCPSGNDALTYCLSCSNCAVACIDEQCMQCYRSHLKCQRMKKIKQFHNSIEQSITPSFILGQIQQNLKQISHFTFQLHQKIKQQMQTFKLTKSDHQIVNKIKKYHFQKQKLSSQDFNKYHKEKQEEQKAWFQQGVNRFQSIIHETQDKFNCMFANIYKAIYYEHLENSKDFQEKIFKETNILQNKEMKNQMLLILKDLKLIKEVKILYCAKTDAFLVQSFHQHCANKPNLLYIVKNQFDKTYGGFSPCPISSENYEKFQTDQSMSSFIFSLDNHIKANVVKKQFSIRNSYRPKGKNNVIVSFGQPSSPNLVISQNSFGFSRDNFIDLYGGAYQESKQNISELLGAPNNLSYKLKQFQVFQIIFSKDQPTNKPSIPQKNEQKVQQKIINQNVKIQKQLNKLQQKIEQIHPQKKQQQAPKKTRGRQPKQKVIAQKPKQKKVTKKTKAKPKPKAGTKSKKTPAKKQKATKPKKKQQNHSQQYDSQDEQCSDSYQYEDDSQQYQQDCDQQEHNQGQQQYERQQHINARPEPSLFQRIFVNARDNNNSNNNRLGFLFGRANNNNEEQEEQNENIWHRRGHHGHPWGGRSFFW